MSKQARERIFARLNAARPTPLTGGLRAADLPGFPGFGFNKTMLVNNVTNVYDIASLGITVQRVTFEYAWQVNDEPVSETGNLFSTEGLAQGDRIRVVVVASDGANRSAPMTSVEVTPIFEASAPVTILPMGAMPMNATV